MSKYSVGDKFTVEIKEVIESEKGTLYRSNFSTLVFDDYGLNSLPKYDELAERLELIDELKQDEYNRGLSEGWELAKRICLYPANGGASVEWNKNVFGLTSCVSIMTTFSPQQALERIRAYEKERIKPEFNAGDVVIALSSGLRAVVTEAGDEYVSIMFSDGSCGTSKKRVFRKDRKAH